MPLQQNFAVIKILLPVNLLKSPGKGTLAGTNLLIAGYFQSAPLRQRRPQRQTISQSGNTATIRHRAAAGQNLRHLAQGQFRHAINQQIRTALQQPGGFNAV